jgi:hypothetical protein
MKTAIYIEDGVVQLVLTPECDFEKNALASFQKKSLAVSIKVGAFYDCAGGWTRHQETFPGYGVREEDRSLILRIEEPK